MFQKVIRGTETILGTFSETARKFVLHNYIILCIKVNLCQKLLFLHQLTPNMTSDCSLFMKIVSSEFVQKMLCTQIVVFVLTFRTILVHNMFCRYCKLLKKIYLYKRTAYINMHTKIRYPLRFLHQLGHQTCHIVCIYLSEIKKKIHYTLCHRQTYQNYEQSSS